LQRKTHCFVCCELRHVDVQGRPDQLTVKRTGQSGPDLSLSLGRDDTLGTSPLRKLVSAEYDAGSETPDLYDPVSLWLDFSFLVLTLDTSSTSSPDMMLFRCPCAG
jgi:hypothetical protein